MKLKVIDSENKEAGEIELPKQFTEDIREDLIARAVLTLQSNKRQPYGAKADAGQRASAELSRRRHNYRGSYGHGISRVSRKIFSRRGTRMNWQGAVAPGTVGGRKAHPPKADKKWSKKINKLENRKAIRSAIAATVVKSIVEERGHKVPENYPFAIDEKAEGIKKTKDVIQLLNKIGLDKELERCSKKKVRAGKGKARGRKYKKKAGPLFVVSKDCALNKAIGNIPGAEAVIVNSLNAELLAPGTIPGRLTFFTKAAIDKLGKDNLFSAKKKIKKDKKDKKDSKKEKADIKKPGAVKKDVKESQSDIKKKGAKQDMPEVKK